MDKTARRCQRETNKTAKGRIRRCGKPAQAYAIRSGYIWVRALLCRECVRDTTRSPRRQMLAALEVTR